MQVDTPSQQKKSKISGTSGASLGGKLFMGYQIPVLRQYVHNVTLGYACIDLLSPPSGATWGVFNDRDVKEDMTDALLDNFRENFVDNCSDATAINVAVMPGWITLKPGQLPKTVNNLVINTVPALEFTEQGAEAILPSNLWMLSGNHRRRALKKYLDEFAQELEEVKASVQMPVDEDASHDAMFEQLAEKQNATKKVIPELEEKLASERKWVVRLIDRGTSRFCA